MQGQKKPTPRKSTAPPRALNPPNGTVSFTLWTDTLAEKNIKKSSTIFSNSSQHIGYDYNTETQRTEPAHVGSSLAVKRTHELAIKETDQSQMSTSRKEQRSNLYVVRQKLQRLFLNYCDYNQSKALEYITATSFVKICKDSGITLSEGNLGIMMSSVLQVKQNLIK